MSPNPGPVPNTPLLAERTTSLVSRALRQLHAGRAGRWAPADRGGRVDLGGPTSGRSSSRLGPSLPWDTGSVPLPLAAILHLAPSPSFSLGQHFPRAHKQTLSCLKVKPQLRTPFPPGFQSRSSALHSRTPCPSSNCCPHVPPSQPFESGLPQLLSSWSPVTFALLDSHDSQRSPNSLQRLPPPGSPSRTVDSPAGSELPTRTPFLCITLSLSELACLYSFKRQLHGDAVQNSISSSHLSLPNFSQLPPGHPHCLMCVSDSTSTKPSPSPSP